MPAPGANSFAAIAADNETAGRAGSPRSSAAGTAPGNGATAEDERRAGADGTGSRAGRSGSAPAVAGGHRQAPLQGWNTLLKSAPETELRAGLRAERTAATTADTTNGEAAAGDSRRSTEGGGVDDAAAPEGGCLTAAAEHRVQDALIWLDLEMTGAPSERLVSCREHPK